MNLFSKPILVLTFLIATSILTGCKSSQKSSKTAKEETKMVINESPDALNYVSLKMQYIPQFGDRVGNSRGLIYGPLLGSAVSLASNAVKQMIANDRKKYMADYVFALSDLYFYDQLSTESVFDPVGLQFSGFTVIRLFQNKNEELDTAFKAEFILDTAKASEIINNSVFRLRLKNLDMRYTKAKMTKGQKNVLNMDIEISLQTSYVTESGQLFDNVQLGRFFLLLRDMPMDNTDPSYTSYYENLKNKPLDGHSFIVPRSFGYYLAEGKIPRRCYSQGAYAIKVKVKESSIDKFVTKVIMDNSNQLIDAFGGQAKKLVQ